MTKRTLTIEVDGKVYYGQIGTIKSTALGYEDHGILTTSLMVDWPGGGVAVGGFVLDAPATDERGEHMGGRRGTAYGLDHIMAIMHTIGVTRWEHLVGREIIVLFDGASAWGARSVGIASTTDEKAVLIYQEHADWWLSISEGVDS